MANESIYLIPNGPKNLSTLFPSVPWTQVTEYYVELIDEDDAVVSTSTLNEICNCVNDESCSVHFLNYLGTFDVANFLKPRIIHEPSSDEFKKSPGIPLQKSDSGIERFNVRSNDTYEVRRKSLENEMEWLQECADSTKAYIQWTGIEGQNDDFLAIVISNSKVEKLKNDREFEYDFVIQFKLANEFNSQRN